MSTPCGHLLYVEDDPNECELLAQALLDVDPPVEIHHVPNAHKGFSYLRREEPYRDAPWPDLILLDINLPVLDGLETLKRMVANEHWRDIPVFMFTSSQRQCEVDDALKLGARDYLVKPRLWDDYLVLATNIQRFIVSNHVHI